MSKKVLIVGDGPAGLSAALFTAKNGYDTTVFGENETAMHYAMLYNYLGISEITGSEFQERARGQVESFGARVINAKVANVKRNGETFEVELEDGSTHEGDFLLLAAGASKPFADKLGVAVRDDGGVDADREGRTSIPGLYYAGWSTRPKRTQAIISAGEGAAAALSILSQEKGKDFHDFDTPD